MKRKVLIIKIGFSETLDGKVSRIPSYGDIIRTTPLLHLFRDDREIKLSYNKYWQEALFEMVDAKWDGEEYILGYKPKSEVRMPK